MEQVVLQARAEALRARREGRAAVVADLRRMIALPTTPPGATAPYGVEAIEPRTEGGPGAVPAAGVGAGLYCRTLGLLGRWLLPREAQAAQAPPPPTLRNNRPAFVTDGATASVEQRVRAARQRAAMYQVEIHKKLAISAACIVFALLGVPLAIRFPRGGVGLVIGTSLAVFSVYYVGLIGGEELGDRLIVSPFFAMWTPNLLFAALGLAFLAAVRREGSTARGGDWDEVRHAVVAWAGRRVLRIADFGLRIARAGRTSPRQSATPDPRSAIDRVDGPGRP